MKLSLVVLSISFLLGASEALRSDQLSRRRCWSSGSGRPAQWWDEGSRIDRGRYWYECIMGELQPRGCFSDTGERLNVYGKFVQNEYEIECTYDERGYLHFKFSACVDVNGARRSVGDTWEDAQRMYWFECKQDGPYLRLDVGGCVTHDKTRRIKLGETYDLEGYTYQCLKKYNGTIQMCSVGCVHNGAHFKIGEQWPDGDFIYYCKLNGARCQKMCIGCQFRNKRLYDGDRYQKDSTVFECEVRRDKYGHKPVACLVRDESGDEIERNVGCRWNHKTKDAKVEQICVLENNKAVVKTIGCVYLYKGYDTLFIAPGTYTIWNQADGSTVGVACKEGQLGGQPTLQTFTMSEISLRVSGLKYERPRG